ncbi:MAG: ATP-grasp domain-containing protein [Bdellovibrionales bacterium]|nr:ATP-grasp domain-containing protein [Bdellovibrionales bacterium]
MSPTQRPFHIGILGGGQLSRMLALSGHRLGHHLHVLSESDKDPAAQVVSQHQKGSLNKLQNLVKFLKKVDVATFESEFLDAELIAKAAALAQKNIFPRPHIMGLLQDRLTQKKLLLEHDLPTLDFVSISDPNEAKAFYNHSSFLTSNYKNLILKRKNFVFKKRRFGYDGYGTFPVSSEKDFRNFLKKWSTTDSSIQFIVEPKIPFEKELALTFARNLSGQIAQFPLVETHQVQSRCDWVIGPVEHPQQKKLAQKICRFLNQIDYVGTITFELFAIQKNLLINEVAPRVHNSAHYSLDALNLDQFSAHLQSLTNAPLYSPKIYKQKYFSMVNLIGNRKHKPQWEIPAAVYFHWYGKEENRPGRKMGHLTCLGNSTKEALRRALTARKNIHL